MGEGSKRADEPDVQESVDSFRRAGSAVSDGLTDLYDAGQAWVNRRHSFVQFAIGILVWFGANWTYNRVSPPLVRFTVSLIERASSEFSVAFVSVVLESSPVLASVQILTALIAIVVAQNRAQTRKLKDIEDKLTTVTTRPAEATDGGTPKRRPTAAWALGLAIAGGALGFSFGPGGVLAGIYFGLLVGGKLDRRVHERDPQTADPNAGFRTEQ